MEGGITGKGTAYGVHRVARDLAQANVIGPDASKVNQPVEDGETGERLLVHHGGAGHGKGGYPKLWIVTMDN